MFATLSAIVLVIAVLYLVYRRCVSHPARLAIDTKTHSLDWMTSLDHSPLPDDDWQRLVFHDLAEAENALDDLEQQGVCDPQMQAMANGKFIVRWRK